MISWRALEACAWFATVENLTRLSCPVARLAPLGGDGGISAHCVTRASRQRTH